MNDPYIKTCPYCGLSCPYDTVDVGVGEIQYGPARCENCGAIEIGPEEDPSSLSDEEMITGWKSPIKDFKE